MKSSEREQAILDAAADLIMQQGYDKTTMGDVADSLGLSRGLVYLHFKSKEQLLEALITREMLRYGQFWFRYIEGDETGGTIGSVYRGVLAALRQTPFLAIILTRDETIFGKYLRKPGNLFASLQTPTLTQDFLRALQDAHAIRKDIDIEAVAYLMDVLAAGLVNPQQTPGRAAPGYTSVLDTTAEMLDSLLTPTDGDREAGKAVLRQFAAIARQHFDQFQSASKDGESS